MRWIIIIIIELLNIKLNIKQDISVRIVITFLFSCVNIFNRELSRY